MITMNVINKILLNNIKTNILLKSANQNQCLLLIKCIVTSYASSDDSFIVLSKTV